MVIEKQETDQLILVNEQDEIIGYSGKMEAHEKGLLHRAFSIFVVNDCDELMIQRRAMHKYHSGGLWANTCCSHPLRNEDLEQTIHRRLQHEMGFDCKLEPLFKFIYKTEFGNGLVEHELDTVYLGCHDGPAQPNPAEVMDWRWIDLEELKTALEADSPDYVYWIKAAFTEFYENYHLK